MELFTVRVWGVIAIPSTEGEHVASRRRSRRRLNTLQVKQLQDGEEIYNALMNASDPTAFQVKQKITTLRKVTDSLLSILLSFLSFLLSSFPPHRSY